MYGYTLSDPVDLIDVSGNSSIVFSRTSGSISVINSQGTTFGNYPAGNNTSRNSNGPWPNGTYQFSHYMPHSESNSTGPYGSNGNFVFQVPRRTGMGVHSGRSGPNSNTLGCVRTTDQATAAIKS